MKKLLLTAFLIVFTSSLFAQVGIGTDMPDPSSLLDIYVQDGDKGVLLTRVALTGTTDNTTITNGNVESLLVYNTATVADVTPGYYYWHHQQWNRILTPADISVATNTTNTSLTTDGVDLILTDSEGNFVSVALSSLFTETITSLVNNGDGTLTYTDEAENTNNIDVAQIVANNETVTTFKQDTGSGKITYTDEAENEHTAEVVSTDTDNLISVGTDGGALLTEAALQNLEEVTIVSNDYSASSSDRVIIGLATAKDITITLPSPATMEGKKYTIRKQNTGENHYVQVSGNIAGIPASENLYTAVPYTGWTLVSDGNYWYIINKF